MNNIETVRKSPPEENAIPRLPSSPRTASPFEMASPADAFQFGYIRSLDGLRAVSLLFVVYGHLSGAHALPVFMRASTLGQAGVIMFFVISGFLITTQLMKEERNNLSISLRSFYVRRVFRLMPALILLIFASAVLGRLGFLEIGRSDVIRALTYTMNYASDPSPALDHLWSLSVEEQFYLLWPCVMVWLPHRKYRIAWAVILICPILRVLGLTFASKIASMPFQFEMVADALAFGCLAALFAHKLRSWKLLDSSLVVLSSFMAIVGCAGILRGHLWYYPATFSIQAASAMFIVTSLAFFRSTLAARALEWGPLVWIGRLSYSLYLWQQMFCAIPPAGPAPLYQKLPWNISFTFLLACISYYFVEVPVRQYGRRFVGGFKAADLSGFRSVATDH